MMESLNLKCWDLFWISSAIVNANELKLNAYSIYSDSFCHFKCMSSGVVGPCDHTYNVGNGFLAYT